eukprot:7365666-Heterocapsa_arctica.AAC.1
MEADKSNGEALRYASEKQKGDKEVHQFYIGEEHEQSAGTKTMNINNEIKKHKKMNQDINTVILISKAK